MSSGVIISAFALLVTFCAPDLDTFPHYARQRREFMQTGRRRDRSSGRPPGDRRGYAQALGTFARARHILGGGSVRPRNVLPRPAAVTPPSSVAGAVWIFRRIG